MVNWDDPDWGKETETHSVKHFSETASDLEAE